MADEVAEPYHILVVDDVEVNRTLLEMRLQMRGFLVTTLDNGAEALQRIAGQQFDMVLLDIMMPEVSGLDVLKQVRKQKSRDELPIIMTTARDQSSDIVEALSLGANDYVIKPIDFPVLMARMESHLQLSRLSRQKDLFLTIASHDLKNPLAVIRGYASLLQMIIEDEVINRDEAGSMAKQIHKQTHNMERIVSDYLDFQALQDGQLRLVGKPGNLNDVAEGVLQGQQTLATEKGINIRRELTNDLPSANFDRQRLHQVCENLVGNAIKFSQPNSDVTLRTFTSHSSVRFEVQDSGPGVPLDERGQLFSKYANVSNRPTGKEKSSGLGLAISRYLIHLHGGEIGMNDNQDGRGSTFWFELPTSQA